MPGQESTTISVKRETTHKFLRRMKLDRSSIHSEPAMDDIILSLIPDKYKEDEKQWVNDPFSILSRF